MDLGCIKNFPSVKREDFSVSVELRLLDYEKGILLGEK